MTTMRMVAPNGQAMHCLIPELRKLKQNSSGQSPDAYRPANEAGAGEPTGFDDVEDVSRVDENKLILHEDGW